MSDVLTSLSLVTLAQNFRGDIVRQINRRTALLKALRVVRGEGKNVAWVPEKSGALTEAYAEGADASDFGGDAQASAILTWGLYRSNFHVSNLAMDAAATSQTPLGNRRLWARHIVNNSAALAALINSELFTGDGSGEIVGLEDAVDNDNTYATIVRSSNSYWQSTVVDPGVLTAPTFAQIRSDRALIYTASGEFPDLAVCSPDIYNKLASLFDNVKHYQVDTMNLAKGRVTFDGGPGIIMFDGMGILMDKDCTANALYYLNTNYVDLEVLPPAEQDGMLSESSSVVADDGFGQIPLSFKYEKLAKTGASEKAEILATCQLKVTKPNACGKRLNIAGT